MDIQAVATALSALGHEARLEVFRLLVQAGEPGLSVGEIGAHTGLAPSTLAHHLGALVAAGLVAQRKEGRAVVSRVDFERMRGVLAFVAAECCAGVALTRCDAA